MATKITTKTLPTTISSQSFEFGLSRRQISIVKIAPW